MVAYKVVRNLLFVVINYILRLNNLNSTTNVLLHFAYLCDFMLMEKYTLLPPHLSPHKVMYVEAGIILIKLGVINWD